MLCSCIALWVSSAHSHTVRVDQIPSGLESKAVMPAIAKVLGEMWKNESDKNKEIWKAGKQP
ncbi:MAG: hypothetical protein ACPIOQ_83980 [Promethearchaeia archaeon]